MRTGVQNLRGPEGRGLWLKTRRWGLDEIFGIEDFVRRRCANLAADIGSPISPQPTNPTFIICALLGSQA
jgi:hypothetical protein